MQDHFSTVLLRRSRGLIPRDRLQAAGAAIREGKVVVFPTETVYGMGADALNELAVKRIFAIKGRPLDNPVIAHVGSMAQVGSLAVRVPAVAHRLMETFWPGPLTLVLRRKDSVPSAISGGLGTISVRMPRNETALFLIEAAGTPVAAPSANLSGRPSITSYTEAVRELNGKVDFIIDGGKSDIGVESTVLDLTGKVPLLLRPGGLPVEQIERVIGRVSIHPAARGITEFRGKAPSPGMKYRHYAPVHSRVVLFETQPRVGSAICDARDKLYASGYSVALLLTEETHVDEGTVVRLGSRKDAETIARNLFTSLRKLDRSGFDFILAEGITEEGIGLAVMNRLRRASGGLSASGVDAICAAGRRNQMNSSGPSG